MLRRILNPNQDELLAENRRLLADLQQALARFDASAEDQATVKRSASPARRAVPPRGGRRVQRRQERLHQRPPRRARSWKRGSPPPPPTSTSSSTAPRSPRRRSRRRSTSSPRRSSCSRTSTSSTRPAPTPSTASTRRSPASSCRGRTWCSSSPRPTARSPRASAPSSRASATGARRSSIVLNKIDILETPEDVERVLAFIAENAKALLGFTPEIFPVAARLALRGKTAGDAALLAQSRFEALERYIVRDARREGAGPPQAPQSPGRRPSTWRANTWTSPSGRLEPAQGRLRRPSRTSSASSPSTRRTCSASSASAWPDVDNVLREFENRGMSFFDDTMRLARVMDLLNKSKMKADFERKVVADLAAAHRAAGERGHRLAGQLRPAPVAGGHGAPGAAPPEARGPHRRPGGRQLRHRPHAPARQRRPRGPALGRDVRPRGRGEPAGRLGADGRGRHGARRGRSAIGLGAVLTHLAVTAAADFTGILAAGTVAVLGFFIIPNRRQRRPRRSCARRSKPCAISS